MKELKHTLRGGPSGFAAGPPWQFKEHTALDKPITLGL